MKRLFSIVAAVLFVATAAFAGAADRDVLITKEGSVYSVVSEASEDGLSSTLVLTVQSGGKTTHTVVPETVNSGVNELPTLAYDAESKSIFLLWMRTPASETSNELLVARYQGDKWQPATVIDSKPVLHSNLSVMFTRQVQQLQRDGGYAAGPALILHTAWWEKSGDTEGARYAVMPLGGMWPQEADIHDMSEFVSDPDTPRTPDQKAVTENFMRHVAIVDGPTPDAVDVVFPDNRTNSFYRKTLRPIADARVHITVGIDGRGPKLGKPRALTVDWSGRNSTITSRDGNTIIFCNTSEKKVTWVTLRDGKWLPTQEVALSEHVTLNVAMTALAKMASSGE